MIKKVVMFQKIDSSPYLFFGYFSEFFETETFKFKRTAFPQNFHTRKLGEDYGIFHSD